MSKGSRYYTVRYSTDPNIQASKVMPTIFREWLLAGYIEPIKAKLPRKAKVAEGFQGWFDSDGNLQIRRARQFIPIGPRIRIWTAIVMQQAIYNERYCAMSDLEIARETELNYQPGGQGCAITIGADLGVTVFVNGEE